jgi:hypothetical protein
MIFARAGSCVVVVAKVICWGIGGSLRGSALTTMGVEIGSSMGSLLISISIGDGDIELIGITVLGFTIRLAASFSSTGIFELLLPPALYQMFASNVGEWRGVCRLRRLLTAMQKLELVIIEG